MWILLLSYFSPTTHFGRYLETRTRQRLLYCLSFSLVLSSGVPAWIGGIESYIFSRDPGGGTTPLVLCYIPTPSNWSDTSKKDVLVQEPCPTEKHMQVPHTAESKQKFMPLQFSISFFLQQKTKKFMFKKKKKEGGGKRGQEISLPFHPALQIICIRHPVTHQTTEKNIGLEKVIILTMACSKSKSHKTFGFVFFSKRNRFPQSELRNQDIPWQALPTPPTRSQLTWQPFPPWVQNPSAKQAGEHSAQLLLSSPHYTSISTYGVGLGFVFYLFQIIPFELL